MDADDVAGEVIARDQGVWKADGTWPVVATLLSEIGFTLSDVLIDGITDYIRQRPVFSSGDLQ
jgi:hypothetical protein